MIPIPKDLIEKIHAARHLVVLTGAGISAESGVPTFREAQTGLWAQYDPEELATSAAFKENPQLVWDWYAWRRQLLAAAKPNAGHIALAQLENIMPKLTLITQNVDGLHTLAGSQNVVELHGRINRMKCFANNHPVAHWQEVKPGPPTCPVCNSFLRPDVVWFGESLPMAALATAVNSSQTCDLFFSIGTSALVHPAASLPFSAIQNQIPLIEINPQSTPLTAYASYKLVGTAGEILPTLMAQVSR
jgi:NAD-dependent deacetylase